MKIGVISDSHWVLGRPYPVAVEILKQLKPTAILHAGDLGDLQLLQELETIAPVYIVAGNCDHQFAAEKLGRKQIVELAGLKIGLIHGDGYGGTTPEVAAKAFAADEVAAVVFGHSHKPYNQIVATSQGECLLFNPGSCARPLGEVPQPSLGILTIDQTTGGKPKISGEIYYLKNR